MLAFAPQDAIAQLDTLVASTRLPARDATRCARLAETLRRPARVCLLGPAQGDIAGILNAILEGRELPVERIPPAIELHFSEVVTSKATLEDGAKLSHEGWPTEEMLRQEPVFLQIDLPLERLRTMSLLVLSLDADPTLYRPALSWAARRSEIAVWCTPSFDVVDTRIWSLAPERLTQHAYLLETRPDPAASSHSAQGNFTENFALCGMDTPDVAPLLDRITADIEEARVADLDMAQLFLHRLRHLVPAARDAELGGEPVTATGKAPPPDEAVRNLLSEPMVYLMARAEELNGQLIDGDLPEDWPPVVLAHCTETGEGLRDRAYDWPEEIGLARRLQAMIEDICDMTTLLQIEGGAEQAQDAVGMLFQLRLAFEQALGWEIT